MLSTTIPLIISCLIAPLTPDTSFCHVSVASNPVEFSVYLAITISGLNCVVVFGLVWPTTKIWSSLTII